jgi:5-methylcytosine-specific restriction endonuclease McrA
MLSTKERNLIKGAIRRVFSRSDLRKQVLERARDGYRDHHDPERPRVTKWGACEMCEEPCPLYKMEVDHINPIVPVDRTLEDMSWDELIARIWCSQEKLQAVCKSCHRAKSKTENAVRRANKKEKKVHV